MTENMADATYRGYNYPHQAVSVVLLIMLGASLTVGVLCYVLFVYA